MIKLNENGEKTKTAKEQKYPQKKVENIHKIMF